MMNSWEEIIKAARDRKGKLRGGKEIPEKVRPNKVVRPTQTRMKGGNPRADLNPRDSPEKDLFEFGDKQKEEFYSRMADEDMKELMNMKRSELMDEVMDKIGSFSDMELIKLVVMARTGKLED
tara:strand:+ start:717 stop:1085 length:369 start_codon:yes stop_codon:yes gene_type:complete